MDARQFAERMALIRARFIGRLPGKIEATDAALPMLAGDGKTAAEAVATIYRRFHELCGIGPTIGFNETGKVARTLVDGVLVKPFKAQRGLSAEELAKLKRGLESFRAAALNEMQSTNQSGAVL